MHSRWQPRTSQRTTGARRLQWRGRGVERIRAASWCGNEPRLAGVWLHGRLEDRVTTRRCAPSTTHTSAAAAKVTKIVTAAMFTAVDREVVTGLPDRRRSRASTPGSELPDERKTASQGAGARATISFGATSPRSIFDR